MLGDECSIVEEYELIDVRTDGEDGSEPLPPRTSLDGNDGSEPLPPRTSLDGND